jgi:hypothetical protein
VAVNLTKTEINAKPNNAKSKSPIANSLFSQDKPTNKTRIAKATNKRRAVFFGRKKKQPYCSWAETFKVIEQIERDRKNSLFAQTTTEQKEQQ